jgi:origin recognition complex subunit 1
MADLGKKRGKKTLKRDDSLKSFEKTVYSNNKFKKTKINTKSKEVSKSKTKSEKKSNKGDVSYNLKKLSIGDEEEINREFQEEDPEFYGNFYNEYSSEEEDSVDLGNNNVKYDNSDDEDNNKKDKSSKNKTKYTKSDKAPSYNGEVEALEVGKEENNLLNTLNKNKKDELLDLPCRQAEQHKIEEHITNGLKTSGCYSSLYISGMPGTGKTASVKASLNKLKMQAKKHLIKDFDALIINGMKINSINNVYKQIYSFIFNDETKVSSNKCCTMLELFFKNRDSYYMKSELRNPKNVHLILLIDEIDCLVSKKMNLLYNIFNWTTFPEAKLIVISISNTMDLPQKTLAKVASRMGTNQLPFKPYSKQELEEILEKCLPYYGLFHKDAISFSCSKVASISGDLRRILHICNAALDNLIKKQKTSLANLKKEKNLISLTDIRVASSDLYDNRLSLVIKGLKLYEKVAIIAISMCMNTSSRVNITHAFEKFDFCCNKAKIDKRPNFNEFKIIIFNLLKLKLISFSEFNENFIENLVFIQIYRDELITAFHSETILKPIVDILSN